MKFFVEHNIEIQKKKLHKFKGKWKVTMIYIYMIMLGAHTSIYSHKVDNIKFKILENKIKWRCISYKNFPSWEK